MLDEQQRDAIMREEEEKTEEMREQIDSTQDRPNFEEVSGSRRTARQRRLMRYLGTDDLGLLPDERLN